MKNRTVTSIGRPLLLSRVRQQKCSTHDCTNKSRLALVMPLADIEDDGGPGLGCVVQCGACIERAMINLTDWERKNFYKPYQKRYGFL